MSQNLVPNVHLEPQGRQRLRSAASKQVKRGHKVSNVMVSGHPPQRAGATFRSVEAAAPPPE